VKALLELDYWGFQSTCFVRTGSQDGFRRWFFEYLYEYPHKFQDGFRRDFLQFSVNLKNLPEK